MAADACSLTALLVRGDSVLDGGFATELEARGRDLRDPVWSARLLRDDPQAIEDVHPSSHRLGAGGSPSSLPPAPTR